MNERLILKEEKLNLALKANLAKKVGVVVPVYNVERYLRECLDSVINQSYENLSIVLVNDGSTDKSFDIAKEYALKDERIILIDKENGGLSSARNAGIEFFSGEYELELNLSKESEFKHFELTGSNELKIKQILLPKNEKSLNLEYFKVPKIDYLIFLDSDDYWELDCVKECVARMDGVQILWFDQKYFFEKVKKEHLSSTLTWMNYHLNEQVITKEHWAKRLAFRQMYFFHYSWQGMIDFEFLKKTKLKFINGIIQEDDYFGTLLFAKADYIYIYPKKLYHYRIRSNSIMNYDEKVIVHTPHYFKAYEKDFGGLALLARDYHKASSFMQTSLALVDFIEKNEDELINFVITKYLLPTYIKFALKLMKLPSDPLNLVPKLTRLEKYTEDLSFNHAGEEIKQSTEYRIGKLILSEFKSLKRALKALKMIKILIKEDKKAKKAYKARLKEYAFASLPELKAYSDYASNTGIYNHLSYKFGKAFMRADKFSYLGYLALPFVLLGVLIKHKYKQKMKSQGGVASCKIHSQQKSMR